MGMSKRWPGTSVWPSWDLLESADDPFSIEREARLHRQAAGKIVSSQLAFCSAKLLVVRTCIGAGDGFKWCRSLVTVKPRSVRLICFFCKLSNAQYDVLSLTYQDELHQIKCMATF